MNWVKRFHSLWLLLGLGLLLFLSHWAVRPSLAVTPAEPALVREAPVEVDQRLALGPRPGRLTERQRRALRRLRESIGTEPMVRPSSLSDTPSHLFSYDQALSAPDNDAPQTIARDFLNQMRDLYGLTAPEVAALTVEREYETAHNQVKHVLLQQRVNDLEVFQAALQVNLDAAGQVINVAGEVYPGIVLTNTLNLTAAVALKAAVTSIDEELGREFQPIAKSRPEGADQRLVFERGRLTDEVPARLTVFPLGQAGRLGWLFYLYDRHGINLYETIVDAADGTILYRRNLTVSEAQGTVFTQSSPQPSATFGLLPPAPNPPVLIDRSLVSFKGDATASPEGWLATSTETMGNNVIAREDKAGDNEATLGTMAKATDQNFTFPLELGPNAPSPLNFTDAAVTNLFYWNNIAHDYFYRLGFTEAAGNFQLNNFGRGGMGGDPVLADAQDGATNAAFPNSFRNNANFATPPDGQRPRMQMFLFGPRDGPYVDSSFDPDVIIHEYTHGVSNRLVRNLGGVQGGAMGEAWSDFFALNYLAPATAPVDGAYIAGAYSVQNFVRGIRTRPYSTDMTINALTYADLGRVRGFAQVHGDGEIWVEALWELRANLIKRYGFEAGKRRVELLVIDGMKLAPPAPSMVDMRDAILLAGRVSFNNVDEDIIWAAFAKRGLGFLAVGGTGDTLRIYPSTELPSPAGAVRLYEKLFYPGESIRVILADANLTANAAVTVRTTFGDTETVIFGPESAQGPGRALVRTLPMASGPIKPHDGVLQTVLSDTVTVIYDDVNTGSGQGGTVVTTGRVVTPYSIFLAESQAGPGPDETALNLRGDNITLQRNLPFEFPYYDRKYGIAFISTNGLISFGASQSSPISSPGNLLLRPIIAPLWFDLRTSGTAQPGEDVYVSTPTSDSVRFRWAAETVENSGSTGKPVNFAVTLFQDGTIRFDYGAGNTGFVTRFGRSAPTVGLSRGTETFSQLVETHHNNASLDQAQAVTFQLADLQRPLVTVLSPRGRQRVKGTINIRVDARDDMDVASVEVFLDGQALGSMLTAAPYDLKFDTKTISNGSHQLFAIATDTAGKRSRSRPIRFTVNN